MGGPVIVVGLDESAGAGAALAGAARLAEAAACRVVIVHVEPSAVVTRAEPAVAAAALTMAAAESTGLCHLDCEITMAGAAVQWSFEVRHGQAAAELLRVADELDAVCIVVGHSRRWLRRRSVVRRVLTQGHRPVLVIPPVRP